MYRRSPIAPADWRPPLLGFVRARARAPHKIARSATDPANLCKTRNKDKSARRRGCERRCGESYVYVIPSGVEESRGVTIGISTGSFDFAQDDSAIAGSCDSRRYS